MQSLARELHQVLPFAKITATKSPANFSLKGTIGCAKLISELRDLLIDSPESIPTTSIRSIFKTVDTLSNEANNNNWRARYTRAMVLEGVQVLFSLLDSQTKLALPRAMQVIDGDNSTMLDATDSVGAIALDIITYLNKASTVGLTLDGNKYFVEPTVRPKYRLTNEATEFDLGSILRDCVTPTEGSRTATVFEPALKARPHCTPDQLLRSAYSGTIQALIGFLGLKDMGGAAGSPMQDFLKTGRMLKSLVEKWGRGPLFTDIAWAASLSPDIHLAPFNNRNATKKGREVSVDRWSQFDTELDTILAESCNGQLSQPTCIASTNRFSDCNRPDWNI